MTFEKFGYLAAILLASGAIAFVSVRGYSSRMDDRRPAPPQVIAAEEQSAVQRRSRDEIAAACRKHIDEATERAEQVAAQRGEEFAAFIRERKSGARPFADAITSWYGKWRAVKPYLPLADDDGHRKYVAELFARHLFSDEELGRNLKRTIESAVRDIETIQNELAVKLREEITAGETPTLDAAPVADEFRRSIEQIVAASQWDAQKGAGSLVVSEVVSTIGTQVLIRLGVSAGVLGAGAANSWWSFGGSLVIGLAVDVIWEWIDDPAGDVEREVAAAVGTLAKKSQSVLTEEIERNARHKRALWRKAATKLLAQV
jgi:hypothetical protein